MALLTRKELMDKIGKKHSFVREYEKRNHFIFSKTEDGKVFFDTDFPLNKKFLDSWEIVDAPAKPEKAPKVGKPKDPPPAEVKSAKKDTTSYDLDQQRKALEIMKGQQELELLKRRNEKLQGEVIPVDLVTIIFSQHTKMVVTEYRNSLDKVISQIASQHNLSNAEIAQMRAIANKEINLAGEKSLNDSLRNIDNIQAGYSLKRGRGERN